MSHCMRYTSHFNLPHTSVSHNDNHDSSRISLSVFSV